MSLSMIHWHFKYIWYLLFSPKSNCFVFLLFVISVKWPSGNNCIIDRNSHTLENVIVYWMNANGKINNILLFVIFSLFHQTFLQTVWSVLRCFLWKNSGRKFFYKSGTPKQIFTKGPLYLVDSKAFEMVIN
jgi:hypothetical protein